MGPKKKFTFRSKKKGASGAAKPEADKAKAQSQRVDEKTEDLPSAHTNSKVVKDKKQEKIELLADEVNGQDVNLAGLEDCEVRLFGSPSTVHITNATRSKIWSGPVSGSVFLESCSECEFVLACQQLRVHSTTSSAFSLHITSRVIIEDCSKLTFAPSAWTYPEMDDHYKISGLDREVNNWDKVDDFNWLASSEPSPNWSISHQERNTDS